jgi:hypothetical protein
MLANYKIAKLNIVLVTLLTLLIGGFSSVNAQTATDEYTGTPKLAFSPVFGSLDQGEIASFDVVVEDIQGGNVNAAKLVVRASEGVTITEIKAAPGMLSLKPFVAGDYAKIDISKEQAYFVDGDVLATIKVEAETDITLPEEPVDNGSGGTDNGGTNGGSNNGGNNSGSGNNNGSGSGSDTTSEEGVYFGEGTEIGGEEFENLPETFDDGSDSDLTGFPDRSVDSSPVSTPVDDDGESIMDKITGNLPMVVGLCLVLLIILAVLMMIMKRKKGDDDSSNSDSTPTAPTPLMATDPVGPSPAPMVTPSSPATPVTPPSAAVMPTPAAPTTPVMPAPSPVSSTPAPITAPTASAEQPGPISETVVKPAPTAS